MSDQRKFFSGNTVEQAVLQAARHFEIEPEEIAYEVIEKKHGFLRGRKRSVIKVDPRALRKTTEESPEPGPVAAEPQRPLRPHERPGLLEEIEAPVQAAVPAPPAAAPEPLEGLPQVPSRWSKEPDPAADEPPRETAAAADERFLGHAPAAPAGSKAETAAPAPQEPQKPDRPRRSRRRGGGLTELPEGPRRARERFARAEGELAQAAHEAIESLFALSEVRLEAEVLQGEEGLEIEVWGPDQDLLLEDRGRLLLAYQHLLPRMIRGIAGRSIHCRVDSDSFHEIRTEQLRDLAQRVASKVQREGRPETLEPMAPDERRIVHITLADDPTVETHSKGQGLFKRVTISPVGGGGQRRPRGVEPR